MKRHAIAGLALAALAASCAEIIRIPDCHTATHVACANGVCTCDAGFGDCDGKTTNGCETDLSTSQANCGACGRNCENGTCMAGACVCSTGFADCDHDPKNGCESDLESDATNCGACGHGCLGGTCNAGACLPVLLASDGDFNIVSGLVRVGDTAYLADIDYPAAGGQHSRLAKMPVAGGPISIVKDLGASTVYAMSGDAKGLAAVTDQGAVAYDFASAALTTVDPQAFDPQSEIAVLDPDLFYTIANTYALYRSPRTGTTGGTLVSSDVNPLAASIELTTWNGGLYWLPSANGVNTLDASGAAVPFQPAVGKEVGGLFGDDTYFYWAFSPGAVERHSIATSQVDMIPTIASSFSILPMGGNSGPVAVWQENADLVLWEGATKRTLVTGLSESFGVSSLVLPDQVLYVDVSAKAVYRIAR